MLSFITVQPWITWREEALRETRLSGWFGN